MRHTDANPDGYADGNSHSHAYGYANADANADSYSYFNIDTSRYSDANTYCEAGCVTTASADAGASAVTPK